MSVVVLGGKGTNFNHLVVAGTTAAIPFKFGPSGPSGAYTGKMTRVAIKLNVPDIGKIKDISNAARLTMAPVAAARREDGSLIVAGIHSSINGLHPDHHLVVLVGPSQGDAADGLVLMGNRPVLCDISDPVVAIDAERGLVYAIGKLHRDRKAFVYNENTGELVELPPNAEYETAFADGHAVVLRDGTLLVFGGQTLLRGRAGVNSADYVPSAAAAAYDPISREWRTVADHAPMIDRAAFALLRDVLYVFCCNEHGDECWALERIGDEWKWAVLPRSPSVRHEGSAVIVGDKIIVHGGYPFNGTCDTFDPVERVWLQPEKQLEPESECGTFGGLARCNAASVWVHDLE
jgi:hypothetical protein